MVSLLCESRFGFHKWIEPGFWLFLKKKYFDRDAGPAVYLFDPVFLLVQIWICDPLQQNLFKRAKIPGAGYWTCCHGSTKKLIRVRNQNNLMTCPDKKKGSWRWQINGFTWHMRNVFWSTAAAEELKRNQFRGSGLCWWGSV